VITRTVSDVLSCSLFRPMQTAASRNRGRSSRQPAEVDTDGSQRKPRMA
jgi:hypothetical protein